MEEIELMSISPEEEVLKEKERHDKLLEIPGVMISDVEVREYPLGEAAAHLVGYVSFNIKNTVIRNGNLYEPGPPAYTYVNLPLPCVHAGAFLRFMSIISYRILVAKRSDS